MEQLPASLRPLFATFFEGFPAVLTPSLAKARALEAQLTDLRVSYRTKITKIRNKHVMYVVMLANVPVFT